MATGGSPAATTVGTATATFLFTDVEGSTQLLRTAGAAYGELLATHRRLLRAAFTAHGGREVDTQGDSFFVAFASPRRAVAAAADGQRSLAGHPWPEHLAVRVRMGMHTGEATLAGESYVGLAVHRSARIAAAGHGGQILLSGVTAALVEDDGLPEGTALRQLGAHRLKDFAHPAAIYQLDVDRLPTDFPPLRTVAHEHRLPVPPGALLGRTDDVASLVAQLREQRTRLVTLTGPGGIGKTRLALEAARVVAADFPGGAIFVPLSPVVDAALVLGAVADAIGARPEAGAGPAATVRDAIGDERTLLVLDNFEQVLAARDDLAALLQDVPSLVVLVTSRQVLRLRAEQQYHLRPLAELPAVRLFAARAAAVRPGFTVDETAAPVVAEICRRLDGLPLAIELAAARVRLLPPETLLARLGERLDVLAGGAVDLPERQRTLRATMDWSYGLLQPAEQALFARLGVFAGGWTVAAAEAVCSRDGEPPVLDSLSVLLDASLLVTFDDSGPEPRLQMLETVRAYSAERLAAAPDREETERRHTQWMVDFTDSLLRVGTGRFRLTVDRLDAARPNLRAAVARVIAAGDVATAAVLIRNSYGPLRLRGAETEAVDWLRQVLPRAAGAPPAVRGRVLVLHALVESLFGEQTAVGALLEEGLRLLPDDDEFAYDRAVAAVAGIAPALVDGSFEGAARAVAEAKAHFVRLDIPMGVASMELAAADLALVSGDADTAQAHYEAAVELAGRLGDDAMAGAAQSMRGLALLAAGRVDAARQSVLEGAELNRRGNQPASIASSLEGLAAVALADGRPAAAATALAAAKTARLTVGTPLTPALPPLMDRLAAGAREQLGDESYDRAWAEGCRLPLLEALDRTLDAVGEADARPGPRTDEPDGQRT
jgi:predicted ATPase/class 3 adenylate cyclase